MDIQTGGLKNAKIGNGFDDRPTTNHAMGKPIPQLDSAQNVGLYSSRREALIVVDGYNDGGFNSVKIGENGRRFSVVNKERMIVWPNGHCGWIQRVI